METYMIELIASIGVILFGLLTLSIYLACTGWFKAYGLYRRVKSIDRLLISGLLVLRTDQLSRLENVRRQLSLQRIYEVHSRDGLAEHLLVVQSQLDFLTRQKEITC